MQMKQGDYMTNQPKIEFSTEVMAERNPLLEGYGKITSINLKDFIGKEVLVTVKVLRDAKEEYI